jgi:hypothetical protein
MTNDTEQLQRGRLAFAASCLKLARQELKDHGREFMKPGEDVYDSAVQYGGKINLTRDEVIEANRIESEKQHPK